MNLFTAKSLFATMTLALGLLVSLSPQEVFAHPNDGAPEVTAAAQNRVYYRIRNATNDTVYFSLHGSGRSYRLGARRSGNYTNPQPPYILIFQRDGNKSRYNISSSGNYVIYENGGRLVFSID